MEISIEIKLKQLDKAIEQEFARYRSEKAKPKLGVFSILFTALFLGSKAAQRKYNKNLKKMRRAQSKLMKLSKAHNRKMSHLWAKRNAIETGKSVSDSKDSGIFSKSVGPGEQKTTRLKRLCRSCGVAQIQAQCKTGMCRPCYLREKSLGNRPFSR